MDAKTSHPVREILEKDERLRELMAELSPKQRMAIPVIVEAEADGRSLTSLIRTSSDPQAGTYICNHTTYWRRGKGWYYNPRFQEALQRARQIWDMARLETVVEAASKELRLATLSSAQLLAAVVETALGKEQEMDTPLQKLLGLAQGADDATALRAIAELLGRGLRSAETILDRMKETAPATTSEMRLGFLPDLDQALKTIYGDTDGEDGTE